MFYKPLTKTAVDDQTGDEDEERFFVLKTFTLFNADQVEGAEAFQVHEEDGQPHAEPDFQPAEELMLASRSQHPVRRRPGLLRPSAPSGSFPNTPPATSSCCRPGDLRPPAAFYETVAHELSHWAECRTGWDHDKQGYAMGELAAEIASCYVAAELGIPQGEGLGNHAAYLKLA